MTKLYNEPGSEVTYIGRFDYSDPAGPVFEWPGSSIKARYKGKGISFRMKPLNPEQTTNWLNVIIDGGEPVPVRIDKDGLYGPFGEELEDAEHEIVLFRRTEAFVGALQFLGFQLDEGGKLLAPPPLSERCLEFIGDSITCGYGNEAKRIEDGYQESQENNYIAYGAITARNLGADCITAAWSGIGVYQNYEGGRENTMPERYPRTLPTKSDSSWDFTARIPDAVIINLGTNDFAQPTLDRDAYTEAYMKFVRFVRSKYANAHIFCAIGSIRIEPAQYISKVVDTLKNEGDNRIYTVVFPVQDPVANGVGGDWHPSAKTHRLMAEQLTAEIKSKLGW